MTGGRDRGAAPAAARSLRILFVVRHFMYLRNYETTLRGLAARGHHVVLGYEEAHEKVTADVAALADQLVAELPSIELLPLPARRDLWTELAHQVRSLRNYLRYLTPRLRHAAKCARRAEGYLYPPLRRIGELPEARRERLALRLSRLLYWTELALPLDRRILGAVRAARPDVIAITPLIDLNSMQAEYLKVGRRLGVPTVHCVASWDNLTNKGVVPLDPDRMLVWNEAQRHEAVELHGVAPERVAITGAQLFDPWFERRPSRDRETFCRQVGLDPGRPFVLYTCSSVFIARYESVFLKRWLAALRAADDPRLRSVGVLIRPHPGSAKFAGQWDAPEIRDAENVAVHPRLGGYPVNESARADYFDSLWHAAAVVGINTSAMLEAGILGKRCYTVLDPEIAESQEGMVHFAHLTRDGFLMAADGFAAHLAQLSRGLDASAEEAARIRRFVGDFLRPHGLDRPATPIAVAALESAAGLKPAGLPLWPRLFQPLLLPAALYLRAAAGGRGTKKWDKISFGGRVVRAVGHGAKWANSRLVRRPARAAAAFWQRATESPKRRAKRRRRQAGQSR
ncbi:hypothetical protein SAMN06265365_107178 [Tistlia consotensis]|uniref:CDP-Glycerol:Poly(Glycerophosphate) glycerophosphotransferase n=1 Tax=Tistlia consotensis USBA 355 TaxID=560819 RepID=A0A1Y6BD70_9PROT|nr:hypothetical protein [Tistlia consotensis]SME98531.1 hypothetical protein SAMN05428998_102180 [Tistlia consotensis USBA 355]SNR57913.1 hypothetical protein SAMN06265365_107178 [Tistlia consotensis]